MRVGIVVPGGVDRGGVSRTVPALVWLIERLARVHDVQVVALYQEPDPCDYRLRGADVHNVGGRWTIPRAIRWIGRAHRRRPFHVLHALWGWPAGTVAAVAARRARVPFGLHLAGGELVALRDIRYGGQLTLPRRAAVGFALRSAGVVTAASAVMVDTARDHGIDARLLPLGIDRAAWPVVPPARRSGSARLVQVASLNPVKDQATLVRAAAHLAEWSVAFHLDVIGEDTLGGAMQRRAGELGVADRVIFRGFLPPSEVRAAVGSAHVHVVSSRHEAGPVAMLEAAMCGVPTVGTAVGHVADLAPEGAVAVPIRDAEGLAKAIAELLADEDRRLRIAERAQQFAVTHDADATATGILAAYDHLARRGTNG